MREKIAAILHSQKAQRGQSLVELAISLTVMLMLLAGAVTFGMALFSYVSLRDAAQEGALFGSFNPNDSSGANIVNPKICDRVKNASTSPVDLSTFQCALDNQAWHASGNWINVYATNGAACEGSGGTPSTPNGIQVGVEYDYLVIMPYVGAITGQTIHLRAVVTDTILEPVCP